MQNSLLFEGDIMGVPSMDEEVIRQRMRDDPNIDEDEIFRRPVRAVSNKMSQEPSKVSFFRFPV